MLLKPPGAPESQIFSSCCTWVAVHPPEQVTVTPATQAREKILRQLRWWSSPSAAESQNQQRVALCLLPEMLPAHCVASALLWLSLRSSCGEQLLAGPLT